MMTRMTITKMPVFSCGIASLELPSYLFGCEQVWAGHNTNLLSKPKYRFGAPYSANGSTVWVFAVSPVRYFAYRAPTKKVGVPKDPDLKQKRWQTGSMRGRKDPVLHLVLFYWRREKPRLTRDEAGVKSI